MALSSNATPIALGVGVPTDSLFSPAPNDGQGYEDQNTGILYERVRGAWVPVDARLVSSNPPNGAATAVANGAQATAAAVAGNDTAGNITFTTTAAPASGTQVTVTFGTGYGAAPKAVLVVPSNAASGLAAAGQVFAGSITATGFVLQAGAAPAASTAYSYTYLVVQ